MTIRLIVITSNGATAMANATQGKKKYYNQQQNKNNTISKNDGISQEP